MNLSPYLANKLARWLNGNAFPAAPANLYVGLWNGNPLSGGTEVGATITGGAARIVVDQDTVANDGSDNTLSSESDADFGISVSATPVPITHLTTHDAVAAGNILKIKALDSPRVVALNDHVFVGSGDFSITIEKFA